jgi:hypothetical protein
MSMYFGFAHHYLFRMLLALLLMPHEAMLYFFHITPFIQGVVLAVVVPIFTIHHFFRCCQGGWFEWLIQMTVWHPIGVLFLSNVLINNVLDTITDR